MKPLPHPTYFLFRHTHIYTHVPCCWVSFLQKNVLWLNMASVSMFFFTSICFLFIYLLINNFLSACNSVTQFIREVIELWLIWKLHSFGFCCCFLVGWSNGQLEFWLGVYGIGQVTIWKWYFCYWLFIQWCTHWSQSHCPQFAERAVGSVLRRVHKICGIRFGKYDRWPPSQISL